MIDPSAPGRAAGNEARPYARYGSIPANTAVEEATSLRLEDAALHAQNRALHERIREVEWTRRNDEQELSDTLTEVQRARARPQ